MNFVYVPGALMSITAFRISFSLFLGLCASACGGSSNPLTPVDLANSKGDIATTGAQGDMAVSGGGDMSGSSTGCNNVYSTSTIAAMRQNSSGCYELDAVVSIAVTPTTANSKSVTIYAQDSAGGDYSAVKMGCSSSSMSHTCTVLSTAKSILTGRSISVKGTYIKSAMSKGGFEEFYIDSITDNASATVPAPTTLMEPDIARSANKTADWFQMVTVNLTTKLVMFDWSPPEFVGAGSCPQYGFGMLPMGASGTASPACSGSTQPAGQTTVNASEILVGTDFYGGFKYTTDCSCAAMYTQPLPTAGQGVSGTITALLNYDVIYGQTTGYQFLDPLQNASFTIQ